MQILTVVIGIIFVLLLLSLLATTMMELLASLLSLRGRNLLKALRNMLASSDANETLLEEFRSNSLYRHLTQPYARRGTSFDAPSYISPETFQSILFDIILKGDPVEKLPERINALPDADTRNVLTQLFRESGGQLDRFQFEVQNWYNSVMDRASGWYKRYTQKILLFMGLGIAVVFNADTVALYDRLSNDPETLAQLVSAAERYVEAREIVEGRVVRTQDVGRAQVPPLQPVDSGGAYVPVDPFETAQGIPVDDAPATYQPGPDGAVPDKDFQTSLEELKGLLNTEIAEIRRPLGLGWEGIEIASLGTYDVVSKILGFILTALAVSLGAPFWFDLLRKLVNIRSSGNAYENR